MEEKKKNTKKNPEKEVKTTKKNPSKKETKISKKEALKKTSKASTKKTTTKAKKTVSKAKKTTQTKVVEKKIEEPKEEIVKEEIIPEEKEETTKVEKIIKQEPQKQEDDDDLYLTRTFKSLKHHSTIKQAGSKVLGFIITLAILIGIGYFIIYPLIKKQLIHDSKKVVVKVFDDMESDINELIDSYFFKPQFDFDADVKITTNNNQYNSLNDYVYNVNGSYDNDKSEYAISYNIINNDDTINYKLIKHNGTTYNNYNENDSIFKIMFDEEDKTISKTSDDISYNINKDDLKYTINKYKEFIKYIIDDVEVKEKNDTLSFNQKNIKVSKLQIEITKDKRKEYLKKYNNELLSDNRVLNVLSSLSKKSKEEVKEYFAELDPNEEININIYIDKKNEFKGIDIEKKGFREFYYYKDNSYFELHLKDISNNLIDIIGNKEEKSINAEVKKNNEKIGSIDIKELTKDNLDISFSYKNYNVSVKLIEKDKYEIIINYNDNQSYIKANIELSILEYKNKYKIDDYKINNNGADYIYEKNKFENQLIEKDLEFLIDKL